MPSPLGQSHKPPPRLRLILGLLLLVFALNPPLVSSQDSPITVSVSSADISTDEVVALTVTIVVNSPEQPQPILPNLDGLAVVDLDLATDVRMINNTIQTEVTYTYLLQPLRTGELSIPPIQVKLNGHTYASPAIGLTVQQGAIPAPAPGNAVPAPASLTPPPDLNGQGFFVETTVSTATPYIGEQIIHTFRIYQAIQLYREPRYDPASFIEFETRGLPVHQYNMEIAGRGYLITEVRTALFAKRTGQINLGPERLMLVGNVYEDPVELYAQPIQIQVQPLPANPPAGFNGAIGRFEVKAWFSPSIAVAHQPATFYLSITGVGNIERLPEPNWPRLSGWRSFQAFSSFNADLDEDQLSGTKVFERLMAPDQVGDFEIPSVPFVYFDPASHEYQTVTTEPIPVRVVAAPPPAPDTSVAAPTSVAQAVDGAIDPPPASPTGDAITLPDINQLASMPTMLILLAGLCAALPMAVVAGAGGFWWWSRRDRRPTPPKPKPPRPRLPTQRLRDMLRRSGQALQQAKKAAPIALPGQMHPALAAALRQNDDNYRAAGQALDRYLSAALNESILGLTRSQLAERLRRHGLNDDLIGRVAELQAQCEMGRYSPASPGSGGWEIMALADNLLFELDEILKLDDNADS